MVVKFPLEMKNGVKVRNINELKENFDVEKVVGYFLNGKLKNWLDARYYEEEAEAIENLSINDDTLAKKICEIFEVEYEIGEIDHEKIAIKNERIAKLKQFTSDENIIKDIDFVAFDQEELADLYDTDAKKIYLCEGAFKIPKSKSNLEYIFIGNPIVKGIEHAKEEIIPVSQEKQSLDYTETVISDELLIKSDETKEFYNSMIDIDNHIICNGGILKFINCVIRYNPDGQTIDWTDFAIKCESAIVEFDNCRFVYKQNKTEISSIRKIFLRGNNSTIKFNDCKIDGIKSFIESSTACEVYFTSCICENLSPPFIDNLNESKLEVKKSKFVAEFKQHIIKEKIYYIDSHIYSDSSIFKIVHGSATVLDSSFEGFGKGVIKISEKKRKIIVTNCNFIECKDAIISFGEVKSKECRFEKCISPIVADDISLSECVFSDCYGVIQTLRLNSESCLFTKGALHLFTKKHGRMLRCTFENINLIKAEDCLSNKTERFFKYFSFSTEEISHALIYLRARAGFFGLYSCPINYCLIAFDLGEIELCKFININTGEKRSIIYGEGLVTLRKNVVHNCVAQESVLDKNGVFVRQESDGSYVMQH